MHDYTKIYMNTAGRGDSEAGTKSDYNLVKSSIFPEIKSAIIP